MRMKFKRTTSFSDTRALRATDQALLCLIEGEELWIPLSLIDEDSEVSDVGDEGELVVSSWWARQQGLA